MISTKPTSHAVIVMVPSTLAQKTVLRFWIEITKTNNNLSSLHRRFDSRRHVLDRLDIELIAH